MPPASKKDPLAALFELLGPAITALVDHLRVAMMGQATVEKVVTAYNAKKGVELTADEVKALLIVIAGISEQKKG